MLERLEEEIKEKLDTKKFERCSSAGASSCSTHRYRIDKDKQIFVKTSNRPHGAAMFSGELESLRHIRATRTVRVPEPLFVIHDLQDLSAIVMEELSIDSIKAACAIQLGENLANLHDYNNKLTRYNKKASKWIGGVQPSVKSAKEAALSQTLDNQNKSEDGEDGEDDYGQPFTKHNMRLKAGSLTKPARLDGQYPDKFIPEPNTNEVNQFGFDIPTSCGYIPQVNEWSDDWVSFYARHRLDKPIRSLLSDHGDRELSQEWSQLQLKVDKFFVDFKGEDKIVPALLHGDLWSGNVAQIDDKIEGTIPVIYDPSSFYGHSEYDLGIARMFGGIPKDFEKAYFEILPKKKLFEQRNKLYQLFHHLNHWDHFGSGYRSSSLNLMKQLNRMV